MLSEQKLIHVLTLNASDLPTGQPLVSAPDK